MESQQEAAEASAERDRLIATDTETNDLLKDWSIAADDPRMPRLAQLCTIKLGPAPTFEAIETQLAYVKPDGWTMAPGATAANGLTTEFLLDVGRPINEVLDMWVACVEDGWAMCAHNARFDMKVLRGELRRAGRDDLFERTRNICTMRNLVKICGLKQRNGAPKWPSVQEALEHFGLPFTGKRHDAGGDSEAVRLLLIELWRLGELPQPQVFYSKARD